MIVPTIISHTMQSHTMQSHTMQSHTMQSHTLKSHPLPLFYGVLNPEASPFIPKKLFIKVVVPKFTKEQMEKVFLIQKEELESDDDMEED